MRRQNSSFNAPPPVNADGVPQLRVRLPRDDELLGVVTGTLGGGRLSVMCKDGKQRLCRIPGKIRRYVWVRDGDIVILVPWKIDGENRADIIWRYNRLQAEWLRNNGHIKN